MLINWTNLGGGAGQRAADIWKVKKDVMSRSDKITSPGRQQEKQAAFNPRAPNVLSQHNSFCFIPSLLLLPESPPSPPQPHQHKGLQGPSNPDH